MYCKYLYNKYGINNPNEPIGLVNNALDISRNFTCQTSFHDSLKYGFDLDVNPFCPVPGYPKLYRTAEEEIRCVFDDI